MKKGKKVNKTRAKLKLHPAQSNIFLNQNTHRTMCCSRRFGKSVLLRAMVCDAAINFKGDYSPLFPSVVAIIMPTLKQARSIHWNPLVDMLRDHPAVEKILKSDFRIVIKGNRPDIILRGCNEDNGDSLRGLKVYFAAFDEVQDVKETVWIDVVSPALADTLDSKAVFCGCMNPETRVITDTGIRKIKEFDQGRGKGSLSPIDANIWGLNKKLSKADGFYNNGFQATLKLKSYHGYEIEGTYNHPVMTKDGWKNMEDLSTNDEIAIDYGMDVWGNEDPSDDFDLGYTEERFTKKFSIDNGFCYLLGLLMQRGYLLKNSDNETTGIYLKICSRDTEIINVIKSKTIASLRFQESSFKDFRRTKLIMESKAVLNWLTFLGVDLSIDPDKRKLPEFLFKVSRNRIIQFLKGFSDFHGQFIKLKRIPARKITLTCPSEQLSKDIQLLLTNLGVVTLRQIVASNRTDYKASPYYKLLIRGDAFNVFKDKIGFSTPTNSSILRNMRKQKEGRCFKLNTKYLWDKVDSITQSACNTYDFTIPETQSYWANGIIVHNTPKGIGTFFHQLFTNAEKNPNEWSSFHQTCYDNPFLDLEKLETQKRNLPAKIFRQEFLATWESFDGQIFSDLSEENFIEDSDLPSEYEELLLGVDWGDINPALVVCGYRDKTYYLLDYWLNPNPGYAIEQRHHDSAAVDFCIKYNIGKSYADPSQPGRILSMRRAGVPKLVAGYNRIEEGNGILNTLFFQNRIKIRKECKEAYDILISYHRDKKDGIILDRVAPSQDDHLCDSLRYLISSREHKTFNKEVYGTLLVPQKRIQLPKQIGGLYQNGIL